ncbi:hypothetical protein NM208_g16552 [Fusarium decemcellulare]|uniref:Uncharacterized protein n=1 Tax=Fusarium decemcellulare TaxID=57161 RepID=A0ACC1RBL2_9HYPO|nr:hypothetical protein NM208_g16552 [Fusarium decemcellulare]
MRLVYLPIWETMWLVVTSCQFRRDGLGRLKNLITSITLRSPILHIVKRNHVVFSIVAASCSVQVSKLQPSQTAARSEATSECESVSHGFLYLGRNEDAAHSSVIMGMQPAAEHSKTGLI